MYVKYFTLKRPFHRDMPEIKTVLILLLTEFRISGASIFGMDNVEMEVVNEALYDESLLDVDVSDF